MIKPYKVIVLADISKDVQKDFSPFARKQANGDCFQLPLMRELAKIFDF